MVSWYDELEEAEKERERMEYESYLSELNQRVSKRGKELRDKFEREGSLTPEEEKEIKSMYNELGEEVEGCYRNVEAWLNARRGK